MHIGAESSGPFARPVWSGGHSAEDQAVSNSPDLHHEEPTCPRCGERLDRLRRPLLTRWLDALRSQVRPYYRCRGAHCDWAGQLRRPPRR